MVQRVALYLRSAIDRGDLFASTNLRTGMSIVWLLRDEPERARQQSTEAMRKWSRDGFHTQHYYDLITQVTTAIYLGEGEAALKLIDERQPALDQSGQTRVTLVRAQTRELRARALLTLAKIDAGERPRLLAEVDALADKM